MSEHDKTVTNLSNRLSIYRGHHQEKEKRYLATYNCLVEKQRQETQQLQQQILNKESKKKSNKTGPRPGSRAVKKTVTSTQQQQSFIPEKVKQADEDHKNGLPLSQPHNTPNNNFVNNQYQPPESQSQQCQQQMTHHNHNNNHLHHHQPPQPQLQIQQPEQPNAQPHQYQQFQHPNNNFHPQFVSQYHQHPSPDSQYDLPPQAQSHQFQAHHSIYNHNHHYAQHQHPHPHLQQQSPHLQGSQHFQYPNLNVKFQHQKPINHGNFYPTEFKELKDEDLACLDNFQGSAELPLSGFSQTYEQEIFSDPIFVERLLDNF